MSVASEPRVIEFEIPDPEPDIYPLKAEFRGPEVFITIQSRNATLANSYQAKQAAQNIRSMPEISMPDAGIEPQGAAFPIFKSRPENPVPRGMDPKSALYNDLRYRTVFRLKFGLR